MYIALKLNKYQTIHTNYIFSCSLQLRTLLITYSINMTAGPAIVILAICGKGSGLHDYLPGTQLEEVNVLTGIFTIPDLKHFEIVYLCYEAVLLTQCSQRELHVTLISSNLFT